MYNYVADYNSKRPYETLDGKTPLQVTMEH
jgi:hypothetical protein